jgi:hypothetical protein
MTNEELKQYVLQKMKDTFERPVVAHEEPTWILACLRVIGPAFCMCVRGKNTYEIRMSPGRYSEIMNGFIASPATKGWEYTMQDTIDSFWKEWEKANLKCDGIINYFRNQYQDEKKVLENRIIQEEEIRRRNKGY